MNSDKRSVSKGLDDGGPFVIWEKEKKGTFRWGMVMETWVCDNPDCQYLHILAIGIDERFKEMRFEDNKFVYTVESEKHQTAEPLPNQQLLASINIVSPEVYISDNTPSEKQDPGLFSLLTEKIKGDFYEILKRRWRMAKKVNRDQWRKMDWSWWEESMLVGWDEVFPDDSDFLLPLSGKRYWVRDLYCITPGCSCKDVTLVFTETGKSNYKELGTVSIDLKRFRINDIKTHGTGTSSEELSQLWKTFQKEPKLKKKLKTRQKEMKIIGPEIAALRSKKVFKSHSKVGRNDPCPCGSGKKYKKCCLDK